MYSLNASVVLQFTQLSGCKLHCFTILLLNKYFLTPSLNDLRLNNFYYELFWHRHGTQKDISVLTSFYGGIHNVEGLN